MLGSRKWDIYMNPQEDVFFCRPPALSNSHMPGRQGFVRYSGAAMPAFPRLNRAGHDAEQRMGLGSCYTSPSTKMSGTACSQLAKKMLPLVEDLTGSAADTDGAANRPNLGPIEGVATRLSLKKYQAEIGVDR